VAIEIDAEERTKKGTIVFWGAAECGTRRAIGNSTATCVATQTDVLLYTVPARPSLRQFRRPGAAVLRSPMILASEEIYTGLVERVAARFGASERAANCDRTPCGRHPITTGLSERIVHEVTSQENVDTIIPRSFSEADASGQQAPLAGGKGVSSWRSRLISRNKSSAWTGFGTYPSIPKRKQRSLSPCMARAVRAMIGW
jgi:hypothetical protein